MSLFCGIDWATEHHDVAVIDDDGHVVARGRVNNDAAGFAALLTLLAEAGDSAADIRSRWRSKPIAACGWPPCARPAG